MSYTGTKYLTYKGREYLVYGWNKRKEFADIEADSYNRDNTNRHAIVVPSWELSRHPIIQNRLGVYYILSRPKRN
jgi:hypothetical protein